MKKAIFTLSLLSIAFITLQSDSCDTQSPSSTDRTETQKQSALTSEASREVGMPNIHNFQEKKMVKMLYELRDNPNLVNYAYLWSEVSGKWIFFGKCIGYGIPYSAQFSNPEREVYPGGYNYGFGSLPQAEPNGLFMPSSAAGTWLMMVNPKNASDIKPVYVEPNVIVSPFELN